MPETLPLTSRQRYLLKLRGIVPLAAHLLGLAWLALFTFVLEPPGLLRDVPRSLLALVGLALLIAAVASGPPALRAMRDLRHGAALVARATVEGLGVQPGRRRMRYADLAGLGRCTLDDAVPALRVGQRLRVTYSPHSATVWTAEPA